MASSRGERTVNDAAIKKQPLDVTNSLNFKNLSFKEGRFNQGGQQHSLIKLKSAWNTVSGVRCGQLRDFPL